MSGRRREEILVAVDIGTSKVCVVVGLLSPEGLDVIGFGTSESRGLKKGEVIEVGLTARCLADALEEAELMARRRIESAYLGISAGHIRGRAGHGLVNVIDDEVSEVDIEHVLEAAAKPGPAPGRVVLHRLVKEFIVDNRDGISAPVGLAGSRLEARVHLVTSSKAAVETLTRCATVCDLEVRGVALDVLASSYAVLEEGEREIGVVVVDIGGGTTDVAIWSGGAVVHTVVISYGGDNVTDDIGIGLQITREHAERLKRQHGCALTHRVDAAEVFEVPAMRGRPAHTRPRKLLATIIEPRMEEIYRLVRREVELSGYEDAVRGGYVITGGAASMDSSLELAERTLGRPVRLGVPSGVGGLVDVVKDPKYASAVGLLTYAARSDSVASFFRVKQETLVSRLHATVREWLRRLL